MGEVKTNSGVWHITVAAALVAFFTTVPGWAEPPKAPAQPPDDALIIRRPETVRTRDAFRKRFRPVIPKSPGAVSPQPAPELYTGLSAEDTPVSIPDAGPAAVAGPDEGGLAPPLQSAGTGIRVSRPPDNRISLREEMVTLSDFDYGKYGGMAFRCEGKENAMRGFIHIPIIWTEQDRFDRSGLFRERREWGAIRLVEAVNRFTDIRAEVAPHLYLGSEKIFRLPFLYIAAETAFELTPAERENLRMYLRNGGFVFLDNAEPDFDSSAGRASLRKMLRDTLISGIHFAPLPVKHSVYHCCFTFSDGPPQGSEESLIIDDSARASGIISRPNTRKRPILYLEGIYHHGRLAGVYSDKGYTRKWLKYENNIPQLKMGVNLVVYALTREGGMTQLIMEEYTDVQ
jgi:hypothetical protein